MNYANVLDPCETEEAIQDALLCRLSAGARKKRSLPLAMKPAVNAFSKIQRLLFVVDGWAPLSVFFGLEEG